MVVGLEVHIQLATRTKLFCSCLTDGFGSPAYSRICPICTGQPGVLREIVTHPHGKTRTEFRGDQNVVWGPFEHPVHFYLKKINRPVGNVYGEKA